MHNDLNIMYGVTKNKLIIYKLAQQLKLNVRCNNK